MVLFYGKILFFFNDVMMTSAWYCSYSLPTEHGLVLEKKKKNFFPPKISRIFLQKYIDFHPQTSILQSKPKKMHKKLIKARTKQALIFEISSNELQKSQKLMGFAPNNILYKSPTSIGLENQELTLNEKKTPKNGFYNQKMRNKKINPKLQLKCQPCWL